MADRPSDDTAYRDHFRCPIRYRANRDAIELTTKTAHRQNRLSDDGMSWFFETHLEVELSARRLEPTLGEQAKDAIARALSEGQPWGDPNRTWIVPAKMRPNGASWGELKARSAMPSPSKSRITIQWGTRSGKFLVKLGS